MPLPSGNMLGPHRIIGLLGAGGMGEVYRARDTRLDRDVAIKVLPAELAADPERLRRFEQEARAVAVLDHPNVLAIHDVGNHEGAPYLVTELLEGESLRARIDRGALPPRKAVELSVQIARGLAAAHAKGIVHRDLKPENVFITKGGQVKILDFGIAKLVPRRAPEELAKATTEVGATQSGAMLGTVGYMSPEQVRGQAVDGRSDIFSFGCVLYEMLCGRRAFARETAVDTISAILHADPCDLGDTTARIRGPLRQIVRRCLEKLPEDRFSSAHDLAFALEAEAADSTVAPPVGAGVPRVARSRRWTALAGVAIAAIAVAGFWFVQRRGASPLPPFQPRRIAGPLGAISDPAVSPSGNEIAYAVEEGGTSDIWVTDIRGGKPIRLTQMSARCFAPSWFPDGSAVAFTVSEHAGNAIWRVPRFGGAAMPLMPNAQDPAISPDGSQIAFARADRDGILRIWVAAVGAPEAARKLTSPGTGVGDNGRPAWSPDGNTLCFEDVRNLWLVPVAGGKARPLTVGDARNSSPVWSRDGRWIYCASAREGVESLWRIPVDGGAPVRVTQGTGTEEAPTISHDGRRLVFASGPEMAGVTLVDLRTGKLNRLHAGRVADFPTIAPDGSAVVFESDVAGYSDLWSQALRDGAPVGEPTRLTDHPGTCAVPVFSPDGRWIAYYRVIKGQRDVWVVPARGGESLDFTSRGGLNIEPAWSPDGRQIAFVSDQGGRKEIWSAPFAAGRRAGEPRRITNEEGAVSYPSWSPDGKEIAYVLVQGAGSDVRIVSADGRAPPRAVTVDAQARIVRWWWAKDALLVSGYWGEPGPTLRMVSPRGGSTAMLTVPAAVALDPGYPDFDVSSDGRLLALPTRTKRAELWTLEAERGSF
jgi:Tol biopolymer transport system component